jgi:hypothetical protein
LPIDQFIGPVKRVALTSIWKSARFGAMPPGQNFSENTNEHSGPSGICQGAYVTFSPVGMWGHRHSNMELFGTEGSLYVPDPNFFGGEVLATKRGGKAEALSAWDHPFGIANQDNHGPAQLSCQLADMAAAIRKARCRCSLDRTCMALSDDCILAKRQIHQSQNHLHGPKALGPDRRGTAEMSAPSQSLREVVCCSQCHWPHNFGMTRRENQVSFENCDPGLRI